VRFAIVIIAALCARATTARACELVFAPEVATRPVDVTEPESVDVACDHATCTVTRSYPSRGTIASRDSRPASSSAEGGAVTIVQRVALWDLYDSCFRDGVSARHPWLGGGPAPTQRVIVVETAAAPRVQFPPEWQLETTREGNPNSTALGGSVRREQVPARDRVTLWFQLPPRHFVHGGPFALAGLSSGPGDLLRLRGGWEAAIGRPWLVFALAGDTDAESRWSAAATAELVSRAWVLPLAFSAGGGVVVAGKATPRTGARVQIGASLWAARATVSCDVVGQDVAVAVLAGASL
jgi:hypothetical protein